MKIQDLKAGQTVVDHVRYTDENGKEVYYTYENVITSVTEKRVNMIDTKSKWESSTGRSTSKHWIGVKSFQEDLDTGKKTIK